MNSMKRKKRSMGSDIEIGYRERRARIHGERMGGEGRGRTEPDGPCGVRGGCWV
jgi:hypothetical protein